MCTATDITDLRASGQNRSCLQYGWRSVTAAELGVHGAMTSFEGCPKPTVTLETHLVLCMATLCKHRTRLQQRRHKAGHKAQRHVITEGVRSRFRTEKFLIKQIRRFKAGCSCISGHNTRFSIMANYKEDFKGDLIIWRKGFKPKSIRNIKIWGSTVVVINRFSSDTDRK